MGSATLQAQRQRFTVYFSSTAAFLLGIFVALGLERAFPHHQIMHHHLHPATLDRVDSYPARLSHIELAVESSDHPAPNNQLLLNHMQHGMRCTPEQSEWVANQEPIQNSNCPSKSSWMAIFEKASMDNPTATLISIGCNRGDDLANRMREWSRNASYSYDLMKPFYTDFYGSRACPLEPEIDLSNNTERVRPVRGFCVEAMKSTYDAVSTIYRKLGWDTHVQVIHAAGSSVPGVAHFPRHFTGFEAFGLGSTSQYGTDVVEVITVDELVRRNNLQSIDMLSIDTEGNDMRVIFGSVHSLHKVRFLEFEYHVSNRWAQSDLQDLVDLLDQFNFDCYWPSNEGKLWRLTGCWHDSYYTKRFWSNVACCNRNEKILHSAMNDIAEPKLP